MLDSLEWAWDLPRNTLDLDTPDNIFQCEFLFIYYAITFSTPSVTATFHRLFDNNSWFLLPESHIVDRYYNALTGRKDDQRVVRGKFPVIPVRALHILSPPFQSKLIVQNVEFTYEFIPLLGRMERMAIMCQSTPLTPVTSTVDLLPIASDFTVHMFPFDTLPPLVTHLHPRFVICNTAQKMRSVPLSAILHSSPILLKIVSIFEAWTRPIPLRCLIDPTFNPPDPPDNKSNQFGGGARCTVNARSGLKRRRAADPKDLGSPKLCRKGGEGSKGLGQKRTIYPRLSKEALQVHDVILGLEPMKSLQTTKESVGNWLMDSGKGRKEKGGWKGLRFFGRQEFHNYIALLTCALSDTSIANI